MVSSRQRGSVAGNIITLLLLLGIVGLGLWLWLGKKAEAPDTGTGTTPAQQTDGGGDKPAGDAPEPIEPVTGTPTLEAAIESSGSVTVGRETSRATISASTAEFRA